ncbi:DUF262 domain-containing HNH endonuclease family protein [Chryseobacterium sp. APV1]|uniref:DUF262 domain-containing HNH endonuclease family protein n=1 Tax=Chryseobacterium urinae TaxID=3058400 RepID=A0ABT8TYW5_9FLAO|nr:DUF262 domain-containing HNH endonuclease family protein [Chryseobacterium sp. APV1]MDO3423986.1 DUF262 domain-containing HNH endonuclease family protein [Chryseobacterium sp. APV1]
MNITPNKLTITQLLATPNEQFVVPSYQRRYAWGFPQYKALFEDIDMLNENDGHLFGTIILHSNHHTGGLNQPELVDGQQRLTTLIILLKAIETTYKQKGEFEKAKEVKNKFTCKGLDEIEKPKLKLGELDNSDIETLILENRINNITNLNIKDAFIKFKEWLSGFTLSEVNKFYFKLTNIAVLIRLDVVMPQDAFKLFETINNRGLRLSATDIIKNFLLGHASKIQESYTLENVKKLWSNIIINLDGIDTDDFIRQFMCSTLHRKITMSKLIFEFKKYYLKNVKYGDLLKEYQYYYNEIVDDIEENEEEFIPEDTTENTLEEKNKFSIIEFLEKLEKLSATYRKLIFTTHENIKVNRCIKNLNNILSKPSYIFLMHFLDDNSYGVNDKIKVLKYFETLMLRRHICERRTSENDDIFSRLILFLSDDNLLDKIKEYIKIAEHIPLDDEFKESFPKHQFKGKLVDRAKYVLESIEYFKRGNTSELLVSSSEEVHLEHIIPQTINTKKAKEEFGDWVKYLGDNSLVKHKKYVNYIGNMTLLGEALNIQAYNNPFVKKKASYKRSNFIITNALANQNDFKFQHVDKRSENLTELALKIWTI